MEAIAEAFGLSDVYAYYSTVYWPLQPELFRAQPPEYWLDAGLAAALALPNSTRRTELLANLVRDHGHGVFSFPLLRDDVARKLAREFDHFVATGHVSALPNNMNKYGLVLGTDGLDGLDALLNLLVAEIISPLAADLYANDALLLAAAPVAAAARAVDAAACCNSHHTFVVRYNASEQRGLDSHHDDSDVTLNVCLSRDDDASDSGDGDNGGVGGDGDGDGSVGGDGGGSNSGNSVHDGDDDGNDAAYHLRFCGFVGDEAHRVRTVRLRHAVGRGVIHLGSHRHSARELSRGARQTLIVWAKRSSAGEARTFSEAVARLHPAERRADLECLSYTHDADYEAEHTARGVPLPLAARKHMDELRAHAELIELASRASDAHIAMLPDQHRDIVRMLRRAAADAREV